MITQCINKLVFERRVRQIEQYNQHAQEIQLRQLQYLLHKAEGTAFGKEYGFGKEVNDYTSFAATVPLHTYDEIKRWIEPMLRGERNVLWPGLVEWFAKSSGTTADKSKFIPVTRDALIRTHYRGGTDCVAIYLKLNPESRFFSGKGLILGGSHKPAQLAPGIHVGDLSACLIQNVSPLVNLIRTPSKKIALMDEWEVKLKALTEATKEVNVTSISGVPSWMMGLIKNVLAAKGAKDLTEVWPNLEVFFHGGISFAPYREQYKKLIPSDKMHYVETYNASEGFFAIQNSWEDSSMLLMIDLSVFYEFIPMDQFDTPSPQVVPLWEVEVGKNYAMVISTPGLWRYIIGDTVQFTSRDPYKIKITGRTKSFINAFGEELMVSNADEALAKTCQAMNATVADYTVGPTFATEHAKAHHTWIIDFEVAPSDPEAFADRLDQELQAVNSDYEAKRYKGIFLERLHLITAPRGLFNDWLKAKGKLGGQHKIPRLSNSPQYIEELQALAQQNIH
jgi:hypothetical protein